MTGDSLLLVSSEFPPGPGGIGRQAFELARWLGSKGWSVRVLTSQDYVAPDAVERFDRALPFPVVRIRRNAWPLSRPLMRIRALDSEIRARRPRLLIASGEHVVYSASLVAAARRIPWIAIEHGWRPSRWLMPAKRWALGCANAVVAVSDYSGRCLSAMGVRPRRLETIRNGADARLFRVLEPSRRGSALRRLSVEGARILVTVGTVSVRKAQDVVIRALPRVLRTHPDALYAMAGLDFAAPQFMGIARELGVADRVRILGPLEDAELVELLNDAEIAILTSRHVPEGFEGFGIAVMEAALCALPAIVAGDSGLAEAVADGETGIVVPPEDVEATSQAILTLMGDGSLRARMGARARERALREYTWEVVTAKYDRLLRSVLEGETN